MKLHALHFHFLDRFVMKTTLKEAGPSLLKEFIMNSSTAGSRTRILVVEDDEKDLQHIMDGFAPFHPSVDVLAVGTADQAIDVLNTTPVNLVLLDLNLGGGGHGLDVMRHARKVGMPTRFVVLTGSFTLHSVEVEEANDLGGLFAIKKPIRQDQIAAIVNRA